MSYRFYLFDREQHIVRVDDLFAANDADAAASARAQSAKELGWFHAELWHGPRKVESFSRQLGNNALAAPTACTSGAHRFEL